MSRSRAARAALSCTGSRRDRRAVLGLCSGRQRPQDRTRALGVARNRDEGGRCREPFRLARSLMLIRRRCRCRVQCRRRGLRRLSRRRRAGPRVQGSKGRRVHREGGDPPRPGRRDQPCLRRDRARARVGRAGDRCVGERRRRRRPDGRRAGPAPGAAHPRRATQRLTAMPSRSRSQSSPRRACASCFSLYFSSFSLAVFGSSPMNSTKRGTMK